jgi:hypothetical protein
MERIVTRPLFAPNRIKLRQCSGCLLDEQACLHSGHEDCMLTMT